MTRLAFRTWLAISAVLSVCLRALVPPSPYYRSPHDDELMVRLAASIRSGHWLGDYSVLGHRTLAKPAGYPMFLAYSHFLPWAPTVTVHLAILAGTMLICRELRRFEMSRPLVLAFFTLVSFFPPFFGQEISRIYRESFLVASSFVAIGLAARLGHLLRDRRSPTERGMRTMIETLVTGLGLGVTLSWNIATKPGWYPLGIVCAGWALHSFIPIRWAELRSHLATLGLAAGAVLLGMSTVVGYVMYQNHSHYGIARLDTFAAGPFADALDRWVSVQSDDDRPYILVDASQRRRVYAISPTAKSLEPYLEAPLGQGWRGISCSYPAGICDESAAWFTWDLRDAVEGAGLGDSASEFESTLRTISNDISRACRSGTLHCGREALAPGALSITEIPPRIFADSMATGASQLLSAQVGPVTRGPYTAVDPGLVRLWRDTVRGLPPVDYVATYRPEAAFLGNTVLLLDQIYRALWIPVVMFALFGVLVARRPDPAALSLRIVALAALVSIVVSLAQLSIMEASSGVYLSLGGPLYLLPTYPLLFVVIACGFGRLAQWPLLWRGSAVPSGTAD